MADHRFEAWRNFILILAGFLVGNMLEYFTDIRRATVFLMEYNKPLAADLHAIWAPEIMACIICLYFFKSVHGVLVTIFDEEYRTSLAGNDLKAMASCLLMTLVVFSLGFVGLLADNVGVQRTVQHAAMAYVLMASPPIVVFIAFDLFHHVNQGVPPIPWRRLFAAGKTRIERLGTWLLEDYASTGALAFFIASATFLPLTNAGIIVGTLIAVFVAATFNSVFDYVANRAYFFDFPKAAAAPPAPFKTTPASQGP